MSNLLKDSGRIENFTKVRGIKTTQITDRGILYTTKSRNDGFIEYESLTEEGLYFLLDHDPNCILSINEVCRQFDCSKSFFRERPHLKEIIVKCIEKEKVKLNKALKSIENYDDLSEEAKKYEKIYLDYIVEMERVGKNWKLANNRNLSNKLKIPLERLLEIKRKYIPYTRRMSIMQIRKSLFK